MASQLNRFRRAAEQSDDRPPPINARFFFTSPYAIDDPLSPLPPPLTAGSPSFKQEPRPFSVYDNQALEDAWKNLRKELQKVNGKDVLGQPLLQKAVTELKSKERPTVPGRDIPIPQNRDARTRGRSGTVERTSTPSSSIREGRSSLEAATTGNPFIRAPSRTRATHTPDDRSQSRPPPQPMDSYNWGDDFQIQDDTPVKEPSLVKPLGPSEKVPVGVSRLHSVMMPQLQ